MKEIVATGSSPVGVLVTWSNGWCARRYQVNDLSCLYRENKSLTICSLAHDVYFHCCSFISIEVVVAWCLICMTLVVVVATYGE